MPDADALSAELAAIRKRAEATVARVAERGWKSDDDAWGEVGPMGVAEWVAGEAARWELRLLAAVEAVLKLAGDWAAAAEPWRQVSSSAGLQIHCADALRAAIAGGLNGED